MPPNGARAVEGAPVITLSTPVGTPRDRDMIRSMRGFAALTFATLGLGCQEPELPPPPIGGGTGPVVPPIGGNGPGDDGSSTLGGSGSLGSGSLDSGSLDSESGSTTAGSTVLVSGQLLDGPAEITPVICYVRLHLLDSLDPGSGLPINSVYQAPVAVRALPQPYAITTDEVEAEAVGPGDVVYVSTICDIDGDDAPDSVGAWYPSIPVQPVDLPASSIDMPLDFVL